MSKDPLVYVRHILESITVIQDYITGLDEAAFLQSTENRTPSSDGSDC